MPQTLGGGTALVCVHTKFSYNSHKRRGIFPHPKKSPNNWTEQGPSWEANSFSASQTITRILCNQCSLPHSQEPVTCRYPEQDLHRPFLPCQTFKIHFNIILSSKSRSSKSSLSLRSPHPNPEYISTVAHTCHIPRPSHSSWFYHPNNIWWAIQIRKLRHVQSSRLHYYIHIDCSLFCRRTVSRERQQMKYELTSCRYGLRKAVVCGKISLCITLLFSSMHNLFWQTRKGSPAQPYK